MYIHVDYMYMYERIKDNTQLIIDVHAVYRFNTCFTINFILSTIQHFSADTGYMHLGAAALRNLELFQNSVDQQEKGSVFWVMNHTHTRFGQRLFRRWLSKPLCCVRYTHFVSLLILCWFSAFVWIQDFVI